MNGLGFMSVLLLQPLDYKGWESRGILPYQDSDYLKAC